MPWRHLVLGTLCSWLHGDSRGFRSRGERIESHGDYKSPPPPGEHEGLHKYHQERSREPVEFDVDIRIIVCREFVLKMRAMGIRIIACAAGKKHLHALTDVPGNYSELKKTVGKAKQKASHAVRKLLPGIIWCEGGSYKLIKDGGHLENSYGYIRTKQDPGAIVWSHNDKENWIDDPSIGIIMMLAGKKQTRIFPTQAGVCGTPKTRISARKVFDEPRNPTSPRPLAQVDPTRQSRPASRQGPISSRGGPFRATV